MNVEPNIYWYIFKLQDEFNRVNIYDPNFSIEEVRTIKNALASMCRFISRLEKKHMLISDKKIDNDSNG